MKRIGKAPQQKQVRRPADKISVIPGFRVKGNRTNRTGPFYYKSQKLSCMNNYVGTKSILLILKI